MRLNILLCALAAVGLTGCGTSTRAMMGPDGTQNQLVTCYQIGNCYETAREVCKGNYKIVNSTSEHSTGTDNKVRTEHQILVKCQP